MRERCTEPPCKAELLQRPGAPYFAVCADIAEQRIAANVVVSDEVGLG